MTEFAIILFLVAVGTIGVVGLMGDNLRRLFGASADSIAGSTEAANEGSRTPAHLMKWSMKGGDINSGPGGTLNRPPGPGGTSNMESPPSGGPISIGNPGGSANSSDD